MRYVSQVLKLYLLILSLGTRPCLHHSVKRRCSFPPPQRPWKGYHHPIAEGTETRNPVHRGRAFPAAAWLVRSSELAVDADGPSSTGQCSKYNRCEDNRRPRRSPERPPRCVWAARPDMLSGSELRGGVRLPQLCRQL